MTERLADGHPRMPAYVRSRAPILHPPQGRTLCVSTLRSGFRQRRRERHSRQLYHLPNVPMDHSVSKPSPAYILCYTIRGGNNEYEYQQSWPSLDHKPTQRECERLVVENWYDAKGDRAMALRELRRDGYFWLPFNERIVKDISFKPDYKRLVEALLQAAEPLRACFEIIENCQQG